MPSTITIMPARNRMVAQLMPPDELSSCPTAYQKSGRKMAAKLRVFQIASRLCMQRPNTTIRVSAAPIRVMIYRSIFSVIMRPNITTKMDTAAICAIIWYCASGFPRFC